MALVFEVDAKGHPRPEIRCDGCGGIIKDHAHGFAVLDFPSSKPGTILEPVFHCQCCAEKEDKPNTNRRSMPIDHFMLYLLNNIQLTPTVLEEAGRKVRYFTD
jgi:hypothetical protein